VVDLTIRPLGPADRTWLHAFVTDRWGSEIVVARGRVMRPEEHPGFVAEDGNQRLGLVTYHIGDGECEIVTIDSVVEARAAGCRRVWLITTNDNLNALRFYQGRGFRLVAVHSGAMDASRRMKPEISEVGHFGIPVRDELELELSFDP
jgi:hypothetical protein